MSKASDAGRDFLAGVLAKLPPELRAQAETAFNAAEAVTALEVLGTGALAQPEISRKFDEAKAKADEADAKLKEATALYTRNSEWYDANKAALEEYPELKRAAGSGKTAEELEAERRQAPPDARKVAEDVLNERGRDYLDVAAWMAGKVAYHSHLFGEPLDPTELLSNPKLGRPIAGQPNRVFSLNDAYTERYGERVAEKVKLADEAKFNAEVDKRLKERLAQQHSDQPFPIRGGADPSVLDVLADKTNTVVHNVDSAVEAYEALQAGRGVCT